MCGRFTLRASPELLAKQFKLSETPSLPPRFNIAPSNDVAAVRVSDEGNQRVFGLLRWGFVPSWAKDPAVGNRMINARAETAATSPAFRQAFRQRRCLILADGFYEWLAKGRTKQPYYFQLADQQPFAFAGLWEPWRGPEGQQLISCTLFTTQPNAVVQPIHDRMPAILQPDDYDGWLDPKNQDVAAIQRYLQPFDPAAMTVFPVTTLVNNPSNDAPECLTPVEAQA